MRATSGLFRLFAAGISLLATALLVITVAAPTVRGQAVRERPLSNFSHSLFGGISIGIEVRDVDAADRAREKLDSLSGAVVEEVDRDSPAAAAGFRAGDVVTMFDGERVRSALHLSRLIEESPVGHAIPAVVVRGGRTLTLAVMPQAQSGFGPLAGLRSYSVRPGRVLRPEAQPLLVAPEITPPGDLADLLDRPMGRQLGATVQPVTGQLAEYFGVETGGALVTEVEAGSPAAAAGLRAGDVLTAIAGHAVRDRADAARALVAESGDVDLAIVRDRKALHLTAKIGGGGR
jgi:serine protease Do